MEGVADIGAECLGVAFFGEYSGITGQSKTVYEDALATPHRGSSVLSEPEYVQTVQKTLGLKWEMSEHLRQEFSLQNRDLEILDYQFGPAALGIKIWSLVETRETQLEVLSTGDVGGESLTSVKLSIVDSRSAVLSTTDVPVEEEEVFRLNATHVGVPRFANDENIRRRYLGDLANFIQHFSAQEREAHHQLASSIMTDIHVDVHQFYEFGVPGEPEKAPLKVWSERPTLRTFLKEGPARCLRRRIRTPMEEPDQNVRPKSSMEIRRLTEPVAPTIVVAPPTELPESIPPRDDGISLSAPLPKKPASIHTRRPSLTPRGSTEAMARNRHLAPQAAPPPVKDEECRDIDGVRRPQRAPTFQLPSSNRDRFRWIHVPYTEESKITHVPLIELLQEGLLWRVNSSGSIYRRTVQSTVGGHWTNTVILVYATPLCVTEIKFSTNGRGHHDQRLSFMNLPWNKLLALFEPARRQPARKSRLTRKIMHQRC